MNAQDWIAIVVAVVGGGGLGTGGVTLVSKVTRLVVAVEELVKSVGQIITDVKAIHDTMASHETRLAVVENNITAGH